MQLNRLTQQITDAIKRYWLTTLFVILYFLVTVATLRHSAAGFASLEGGSVGWGYLSALAVDAGMALSATGLRKRFDWSLLIGLLVSASASTFTQLLYAVAHAALMPVADGAAWMGDAAVLIANWRVVALPALLPLLSIVYSFASKSVDAQETVDEDALRDELAQRDGDVARLQRELEYQADAVEAWGLLNATDRAKLIAECANGNRPAVADAAQALDVSTSTVRRGYGEAGE